MNTTILGEKVDIPIGISPVSSNGLAWPGGEINVAKAARAKKVCHVMSNSANASMDEVVDSNPDGLKWYQLYIMKDRAQTERRVRQAEQLGFKALVVTADAPVVAHRRPTLREPLIMPPHLQKPCLKSNANNGKPWAGLLDPSISWEDLGWLKSISNLPIIVKGVMTGEDAEIAVREGVAAVWVSNHGGRQLDTSLAAIEVLPEVVSAVQGKVEVYVDGGVRLGTDVLKAIALGARAVFVGRPAIWGLACKGQEGVESVLKILKEEFSVAMAIAGCTTLDDINSSLVVKHRDYVSSHL